MTTPDEATPTPYQFRNPEAEAAKKRAHLKRQFASFVSNVIAPPPMLTLRESLMTSAAWTHQDFIPGNA